MDVVIAGAGITGLAAAISLRRSGHRVTIYERSSMNNELGAAINVPPNVARFLVPMGLDPVKARQNVEIFGESLWYCHRVDLHESLKRLATDSEGPGIPVEIQLKSEIIKYDPDGPSITLADGTVVAADLVVAADGVHSVAVEAVIGHDNPPQPANHSNCCYRFLISRSDLEAHDVTKFFVEPPGSLVCRIYADHGRSRRLVPYPCRDYEIVNFVGICRVDNFSDNREDWQCSVDKSELVKVFEGYHPSLLAVLDKATEVKRWPLLYRPPIATWYKGRLALAGDAAHPMLPHHGQGGAQGMEDGLALGLAMHGVTDPSQIEKRLALYEKIRRNRACSIQVLSNFGFDESAAPELADFLEAEGGPIPKSTGDMVRLAYGHDVVKRTVAIMTEFDPGWKLPDGLFPARTAMAATGGRPSGTTKQEKIDGNLRVDLQEVPVCGGIEAA
ncbi:FAD/NAD(P)-binding domain-containing protein [Coniochaeta hoffmannii]|uniref:FAD/NAD(P)-binding domain-containing protein n=1 Tax=Coniochaeta hoffmannii TaxID=91930 RepID=A0AA38SMD4_9PEZI|nr:FAD/NAD(P)-binding domain-containing protein [Coniochaeta hoffmannii]